MVNSLQVKIGLLFLAFLGLIITSVLATAITVQTQRNDALVINLAGRQRMLGQQMSKMAGQLKTDPQTKYLLTLQESAMMFDQTLKALIQGGLAPYSSNKWVTVNPSHTPIITLKLLEVQKNWDLFQKLLRQASDAEPHSLDFKVAVYTLEQLSPQLVTLADEAVQLYEGESEAKVTRLYWIQAVFFLSALGLFGWGFVLLRQLVVRPLQELGEVAQRLGQGQLSQPLTWSGGASEIMTLADHFETMRAKLHESQQQLTAWATELEQRVRQRTQELTTLHEVTQDISSRLDINHVLRAVTHKTRLLLGAEVAFLCLLDDTKQQLTMATFSGPPHALAQTTASIEGVAIQQVLGQTRACHHEKGLGGCGIVAAPYRVSQLAAPLRVQGMTLGALCVGSSQPHTFTPEQLELLTKLADSVAIALENARLYSQAERVAMLEERQRIAADMHDGLAQTLSYLKLKIEQATLWLEAADTAAATQELDRVYQTLDNSIQEVRYMIANLQEQSAPQSGNLQQGLARLVNEFEKLAPTRVELAIYQRETILLSSLWLEQVLRVVREAMLNAQRHAQAQRIGVSLLRQGNNMVITVADDGQGFDPQHLPRGHFGLQVMRARAQKLGGQLTIFSGQGQGTQITLSWPYLS